MKEILVSGDVTKDFTRLGINAILTYDNEAIYKVYEVPDEDFKILDNEPDVTGTWIDCGWRYSDGSNIGQPQDKLIVNNKELICWYEKDIDEDDELYKYDYDDLLEYLYYNMGCSMFKNVCALSMDLAKYNNLKLSELFKIYQTPNN